MSKDKYTDYQLKIINGEIPMDTVRGNILARLKNKAIQLNNSNLVKKLEFELELKKEAAKKRNIQHTKSGYHERKKRGFAWKPAKTTLNCQAAQIQVHHYCQVINLSSVKIDTKKPPPNGLLSVVVLILLCMRFILILKISFQLFFFPKNFEKKPCFAFGCA